MLIQINQSQGWKQINKLNNHSSRVNANPGLKPAPITEAGQFGCPY